MSFLSEMAIRSFSFLKQNSNKQNEWMKIEKWYYNRAKVMAPVNVKLQLKNMTTKTSERKNYEPNKSWIECTYFWFEYIYVFLMLHRYQSGKQRVVCYMLWPDGKYPTSLTDYVYVILFTSPFTTHLLAVSFHILVYVVVVFRSWSSFLLYTFAHTFFFSFSPSTGIHLRHFK